MKKFNEFLLTFFYLGKIKKAPGTFASIGSIIFWILITIFFLKNNISNLLQNIFWILLNLSLTIHATISIPQYSKKFKEIDHKSIVIDEFVGQTICLQIAFLLSNNLQQTFNDKISIIKIFLCFILFRFFDITKPSLIGYCDKKIKNGFGVMLDDIISGIISGLLILVFIFIFY